MDRQEKDLSDLSSVRVLARAREGVLLISKRVGHRLLEENRWMDCFSQPKTGVLEK